jgi:sugar phosphate isomerase/epimerase
MGGLARLSIHTMTTKPWSLAQSADAFARAGIGGITVWRQHLEPYGPSAGARLLRDAGLACTALCRGGFFPAGDEQGRQAAIEDNRRAIADAQALGAPMVVLVCGAVPGLPLRDARAMIEDGIRAIEPDARAAGVILAIEPLHPQYAADRSAITTLAEARRLCERIASPWVKIALDVYHVWWDPEVDEEIARCGAAGLTVGFHLCDWRVPTRDPLNDRAIMGEGVIEVADLRRRVRSAGFSGYDEVEIFSTELWAQDQHAVLARIIAAYQRLAA